jgi:hypothetical protein
MAFIILHQQRMILEQDDNTKFEIMAYLALLERPSTRPYGDREWYIYPRSTHWRTHCLFNPQFFHDYDFQYSFRMSRESFNSLCHVLADFGKHWQTLADFGKYWQTLADFGKRWQTLADFGKHVGRLWQTLVVMCQRDKSQMTKVDGVRRKSCDPESFYIRTSLAP